MIPVGGGVFLSHDLSLLESMEFKQRIKQIADIIEEVKWEDMDPDLLTRFVLVFGLFLMMLIVLTADLFL